MGCHAFPVNKFDAPEIHIDSKYRIELGCLNRPEQESRAESTKAAWARRRLCEPTQIGRSFRRVDQFHNRPADRPERVRRTTTTPLQSSEIGCQIRGGILAEI